MTRLRTAIFATLLALLAGPAFAQEEAPDLAELWRVGSLWQVGDNRDRVADARQAIIDSGEPGLKFALTKLGVAGTLEVRCLRAVFAGFGADAYDDLVANITHEDANARRNVAELLMRLDDTRASDPLLAQAQVEESLGARLAQLAALSKWAVADAVHLIVQAAASETDRIRHRATALLKPFETEEAISQLIVMLEDEVYYVREGARSSLAGGSVLARAMCLKATQSELALEPSDQNVMRLRLLLPIIATLAMDGVPEVILEALSHELGSVRGDAATALVTWKLGAGLMDNALNVDNKLRAALDAEYDPFAKTAIKDARARLSSPDEK